MATRAESYAAALFEVARAEGSTEEVEDELFRFARVFEASDELRAALTDRGLPADKRQGIVEELLDGKASPITVSLISFVVGAGRARELPAIIDALVKQAAEDREHEVAEVRSAIPLDRDQQQRLAAALTRATGKQVELRVVVDESILGGIVAQVGDTVIDGSVRHRLDQLRERM